MKRFDCDDVFEGQISDVQSQLWFVFRALKAFGIYHIAMFDDLHRLLTDTAFLGILTFLL